METRDLNLGADANGILQYLGNFPTQFISVMEIARRAEGRGRFKEEARWAHVAISQLLELSLIETDGNGRYRIKSRRKSKEAGGNKFIAPAMREILEKSTRKIDLSDFR
jgi:hypothetical protein